MTLTMTQKQAVTKQLALEYDRARKRRKSEILDSLVELTGYNRSYAARVLRQRLQPKVLGRGVDAQGRSVLLVEDERTKSNRPRRRRRVYDRQVQVALYKVWLICDGICGKRLAPYLEEIVPKLRQLEELNLQDEVAQKLMTISASTIDRLLAPLRKRYQLRARSQTKPGTLLKHQIPIRTFSEWDEQRPGFVEIDLVSHEGGNPRGEYAYTLDATDVATGWTETEAVRNRSQTWVFAGLQAALDRFPFAVCGIDSDNGSEFINYHLLEYCNDNKMTFTRSRPYRKNDNCFVEQKNYSVVRRAVGYRRYDTPQELETLNRLYAVLRLYTNFFQPVMKLVDKTRHGAKVRKRYDRATTPYRRTLEADTVPQRCKDELQATYDTLNPVKLQRKIHWLQEQLNTLARVKMKTQRDGRLEYIST